MHAHDRERFRHAMAVLEAAKGRKSPVVGIIRRWMESSPEPRSRTLEQKDGIWLMNNAVARARVLVPLPGQMGIVDTWFDRDDHPEGKSSVSPEKTAATLFSEHLFELASGAALETKAGELKRCAGCGALFVTGTTQTTRATCTSSCRYAKGKAEEIETPEPRYMLLYPLRSDPWGEGSS